ncbi:MAG: aldehyde dehydrogenase family protein, partial [Actinobacteria bacterium]|nr:aldehyde dehydrogenase family protein [Actinomycetota bacterium]
MSTFDSVNPARPSEVVGTYPTQGPAEVHRAVEAAAAAQRRWARVPIPARAGVVARAGEILLSRKAELAEL